MEKLLEVLKAMGLPDPDVYPFPDGNICFEWGGQATPLETIVRLEVEEPGRGQIMVTFADKRPAIFVGLTWENR